MSEQDLEEMREDIEEQISDAWYLIREIEHEILVYRTLLELSEE